MAREAVPFNACCSIVVAIKLGEVWGMTPVTGLLRTQELKNWGLTKLASVGLMEMI